MIKKIHKIMLMVICISIFSVLFLIYRTHQMHYFSCTAHYQSDYGNYYMRGILRLMFNGRDGVAFITGEVNNKKGESLDLNRKMIFSFESENSNYILHSVKGIREGHDKVDDDLLEQLLNTFYFKENKSVIYKILQQKNGDYIIVSDKLPLAYCHHVY